MQEKQPLQKPRTVDFAVKLIVIGVVASFVLIIFWAIVDYSDGIRVSAIVFNTLLGFTLTVGALLLLALKIAQGRNWARRLFTLLVLTVFACAVVTELHLLPIPASTEDVVVPTYQIIIGNVSQYGLLILHLIAVTLLHLGDSNSYFNRDADPSFAADR